MPSKKAIKYYEKGRTLQQQQNFYGAERAYRKAIKLNPDFAEAHNNLGNVLLDSGKFKEAEIAYKTTSRLLPNHPMVLSNTGNALQRQEKNDEAIIWLNRAIAVDPSYADSYYNRGNALKELGQLREAVSSYNMAIKLNPNHAQAYTNRGNTEKELGQLEDAITSYKKAVQLNPDLTQAYSNLLLSINYHADLLTTKSAATMARNFGDVVTARAQKIFSSNKHLSSPEKLRVGFVSGDLCNHPVGYFIESVLQQINPARLELFAYPTTLKTDELSKRITPLFSTWRPIFCKSDMDAAKLIHSDGIHILFDLSGHTAHNRLPMFGWKPAPIQVSWLGYFATTGLSEMDYLLGDPYVTPPENDHHFTEKIWRLPTTRWCFTIPSIKIDVTVPPALKNGYITFGCFNNLIKMNDSVVELWSKVLNATPDSRLLLKAKPFRDQLIRKNVLQRFSDQGINNERIILEESEKREQYFAAYSRVDIALDPFPFTGGTTSVEGLWMGVPVLTLAGDSLVSRQGVGILMNIGMEDWIAHTKDEYITKSATFASDVDKLSVLRSKLRSQLLRSPLFDAQSFAQNFERAIWEMWGRHLHEQEALHSTQDT